MKHLKYRFKSLISYKERSSKKYDARIFCYFLIFPYSQRKKKARKIKFNMRIFMSFVEI